ncbi:MAG: ABC transporter substrate-binding protein [Bacteroidia bacterium]
MIFPQNLRLPLSGSKFRLLVLMLLTFTFSSCFLFEKTERADKPAEEDPTAKDDPDVREVTPDNVIDTLDLLYPRVMKNKYSIAMLLPLHLDWQEREVGRNNAISRIASEYYWGALLALDTLKACGIDFDLHVHDTKDDTLEIVKLLRQMSGKETDLIIGPMIRNHVKMVYEFSALKRIPFVSPFYDVADSGSTNHYFLLSVPQQEDYGRVLGNYLNKTLFGQKLYIVREPLLDQKAIADKLRQHLDTAIANNIVEKSGSISNIKFSNEDFEEDMIIFVPTDDELFVNSLFNKIAGRGNKITVVGLNNWLSFQTFDPRVWSYGNVHILTSFYVDYEDKNVVDFVLKYREQYKQEPRDFAFRGYDDMLLYASRLVQDGKYFQRYIDGQTFPLLHSKYQMEKDSATGGYYNHYLHLLKYEDDELTRVKF